MTATAITETLCVPHSLLFRRGREIQEFNIDFYYFDYRQLRSSSSAAMESNKNLEFQNVFVCNLSRQLIDTVATFQNEL